MPTSKEHREKAEHNEDFVSFVEEHSSFFDDWIVTGLFYVALHEIERYLAEKAGYHCYTHARRNRCMSRFSDLKPIWNDYQALSDLSRDARYECIPITSTDVVDAKSRLDNIKKHVRPLLSSK